MITTTARLSGPPVSMFSRKLMNSMLRWFSSSSTSSRCLTDRARTIEGPDQHYFEAAAAGIGQQLVETRAAGPGAGYLVGVFVLDLESPLLSQLAHVIQLGLRMLVEGRNPEIKGGAFHGRTRIP
jgi:hypothetical protein